MDVEKGEGILTREKKQKVLDSVIEDVKEGNIEIANWRQYRENQEKEKMLELSFDLRKEDIIVTQELTINQNCVHTLQALKTVQE